MVYLLFICCKPIKISKHFNNMLSQRITISTQERLGPSNNVISQLQQQALLRVVQHHIGQKRR